MMWVWARHGNTFGPGDTVVYAGKRNDLPLVAHGIEQAHRLADAWCASGMQPAAICCGTLVRLRQTADIVCQRLGWSTDRVQVDARLDELDYGDWTGQTRAHVVAQHGEASVAAWETQSIWPKDAGWTSDAIAVQRELADWMAEMRLAHGAQRPILAISSNGRLRYALIQVPGAFAARQQAQALKVRTGHVGAIWQTDIEAQVMCWDAPPAAALGRIAQRVATADALG